MLSPAAVHGIAGVAACLVAAVWESAVLAGFVVVSLRVLPVSAAVRSRVWMGAFVVMGALPVAGALLRGMMLTSPICMVRRSGAPGVHVGLIWAVGLAGVWVLVSAVRGVQLLHSAWHLRGVARRALAVEVAEELKAVPGARGVGICSSEEVDVPSVVGFFAPRILLPAGLVERISTEDLRQIVLHEMEHLRRRDDWTNLVQKVGLVVFPLNPVMIWVERRLCAERELACDDGVLRQTGAGKAYATCLANLAEQSLMRRGVSLALGAWQRESELSRRVRRILSGKAREMGRWQAGVLAGVMLVGVVGGGVELARMPEMIAFGRAPVVEAAKADVVAPVAGARMQMVKAVMPESRPVAARVAVRRAVRKDAVARQQVQIAPRVVLLGWEAGSAAQASSLPAASYELRADRAADGRMVLMFWQTTGEKPVAGGDAPSGDEDLQKQGAVQQDLKFRYAAVPYGDGWLIVQL